VQSLAHFGWPATMDADGLVSPGGGKALRPALVLLCCQAMGGQEAAGLPAAVAVELLHNASLLHDDIIDGDRTRRGRPALWATAGVPAAILTGDALLFLAIQTLAQTGGPLLTTGVEVLIGAAQQLISGEYADVLLAEQTTAQLKETQAMAQAKTGALIAMACRLGALAAGADIRRVEHFGAFGALVGEAFQLTDDLLGIWGDPIQTGKPVGSDLRARKKSLPVSYALASAGPAGRELAELYARPTPLTDEEVAHAARLVEEAVGREWSEHRAVRRTTQALRFLEAAQPEPVVAQEITELVSLLTRRDR
jgi:geranylgeranyl diphosphate synthase type I